MKEIRKSAFIILLCAVLLFVTVGCDKGGAGEESSREEASGSGELSDDLNSTEPEDDTPKEEEPEEPPVLNASEPGDYISYGGTIHATMTEAFQIESHYIGSTHCRVIQGGCTDGTYFYVILNDGESGSDRSISTVRKYEIATGALVATYEDLLVSHGNDMTYVPDTNEIVIVHNNPEYRYISIYDADTMEFKDKIDIGFKIYSLAYDEYEDCFWAGISGGYSFVKLDRSFFQVGKVHEGVDTGYIKQGLGVDSKYLYFIQYWTNSIVVYDKTGEFVRIIVLPKESGEPENISCIGDDFYIAYGKTPGGIVYKTELSVLAGATVEIDMQEFTSLENYKLQEEQGAVLYYPAGSCSDGAYLYLAMNNNRASDLKSVIHKIDLQSGEIVATKEGYTIGRSKDMTYNPDKKQIVVAHGDLTNTLTILDAETLDVVETRTLDLDFSSIAYDDENDCYWAGNANDYKITKLNASFEYVSSFVGKDVGHTLQGIECYGEYIYCVHTGINAIAIYRTDGRFVGYEALNGVPRTIANSICLVDDTFYVGYNLSSEGGVIYRVKITVEK